MFDRFRRYQEVAVHTYLFAICHVSCGEHRTMTGSCVFGRPAACSGLRIQPFCYFNASKTVAAVVIFKNNILTNIFSSLVNHPEELGPKINRV